MISFSQLINYLYNKKNIFDQSDYHFKSWIISMTLEKKNFVFNNLKTYLSFFGPKGKGNGKNKLSNAKERICARRKNLWFFNNWIFGLSNITADFILHYGLLFSVLLKLLRILVDCNIALTLVRFFEVV